MYIHAHTLMCVCTHTYTDSGARIEAETPAVKLGSVPTFFPRVGRGVLRVRLLRSSSQTDLTD